MWLLKNPQIAACCPSANRPDAVSAADQESKGEQWDVVRKPLWCSVVQCDWRARVSVASWLEWSGDDRGSEVSVAFQEGR